MPLAARRMARRSVVGPAPVARTAAVVGTDGRRRARRQPPPGSARRPSSLNARAVTSMRFPVSRGGDRTVLCSRRCRRKGRDVCHDTCDRLIE